MKIKVGDIVERTAVSKSIDGFTWVKGSFGRVTEIGDSIEHSVNVDVRLALTMMNNGHGPIATWSEAECKKRSTRWLDERIKEIAYELDSFKRKPST